MKTVLDELIILETDARDTKIRLPRVLWEKLDRICSEKNKALPDVLTGIISLGLSAFDTKSGDVWGTGLSVDEFVELRTKANDEGPGQRDCQRKFVTNGSLSWWFKWDADKQEWQ